MAKAKDNQRQTDSIYLTIAILLALASIVSFYFLTFTTLVKVLILLGGLVVSVVVLFQGSYGGRISFFAKETKIELLKVIWPSKNETTKMTLTIIVAVIIIGIFLWLIDGFLLWAVQSVVGT